MFKVYFYNDGKVVQTITVPTWAEARDEAYDYTWSHGGEVRCYPNHIEVRA